MANDLDLTKFNGFVDKDGLSYFKERNDELTDEKIEVETNRAKSAENSLNTAISNEVSRAKAAEQANTTAINTEVTRAKSAEKTLTDDLADEISRATDTESTLTTNLNAEISRAKTAEKTNADAISSEVTRAKNAESNLDSKKIDKTVVATSSALGLVKSGTDITVDSNGNVSVNDNSHSHLVSNISDLTATVTELNIMDGVTATTAEINKLDGLTATTTELNYMDGVTSNVQTQLNAKVPTSRTVNGKALSSNISLSYSDVGADASGSANTALTNAKSYTDTKINALVGEGASTTLDTIGEISKAIEDHQDVTDALNAAIGTKANASDLTSHTGNKTVHIESTERTNWNDANSKKHTHSNKTVLDNTTASYTITEQNKLSGIASGAEVNQNAFSNVKVGSTTVAADSKTDTLELVAGSNVTITPDATNDKITIAAKDTVYTHPSHTAKSSGLYKITVDASGHVSGTTAVAKSDITALGIPASDTVYTLPSAGSSLGGVKSGGDVTISSGVITVNDDSHNHVISNIDGLQSALDGKSGTSHTHSYLPLSGGSLTGTLTANSSTKTPFYLNGNLPFINKAISWSGNSYIKNVILLIPVPTTTNWSGMNYFDGKFLLWKTGGNVYDVVEVNLNCVYNSLRYSLHSYGDYGTSWKLCVCKYNGVLYYALNCPYHANPYNQIEFTGHVKSDLTGGTSTVALPLGVDYYNDNTSTVINSEVNSSLTNTLTTSVITSASASSLYSIGGFTGTFYGNATTATNVAWSGITSKPSYYDAKAIKSITRSGTTFTYTCMDGTTGTFTQQDNNTTYTLGSFGITATAAELNTLDGITATVTELNYCDGVTSNIQTQLNGKAASSHNHVASNITSGTLSSDRLPTVPVAKGGTGQTTAINAANAFLNALETGSSAPTDNDYYIAQYAGGGTTTTTYHRRPTSALWSYIKSKADSVYAAKSHTHNYAGSSSAGGAATSANALNAIIIPSSANLNSYTTSGFYYCPANATVATLSNTPTSNAFFMVVGKHAGTYQEITEYTTSNPKKYMRNYYNSTWSSWYRVYTTADAPPNTTYSAATTSAAGLMSAADKSKLDAITASADSVSFSRSLTSGTKIGTITINGTATDLYCQTNTDTNTTYSQATSSTLGLVKIGYTESGKNYPVELNSSGQMYVNVPWTDTNTNTTNTAGSTDTSSKIFLIGATSQATAPQTYSHDTCYVGTDGCLYSGGTKVSVVGHTHDYAAASHTHSNYSVTSHTHANATASTAGMIKVSSVNTSAVTVNSESTTSGRYYPVELNSDGKAIVNVPWTDSNTDTKVTNTLGTTTKFYLTGTNSSSTNTGTQYFDTGIYSTTTAGELSVGFLEARGAMYPNTAVTQTVGTTTLPFSAMYAKTFSVNANNSTKSYGGFNVSTVGTTSTTGVTELHVGNNIATGTANNAAGHIFLYNSNTCYTRFQAAANTSNVTINFPGHAGTVQVGQGSIYSSNGINARKVGNLIVVSCSTGLLSGGVTVPNLLTALTNIAKTYPPYNDVSYPFVAGSGASRYLGEIHCSAGGYTWSAYRFSSGGTPTQLSSSSTDMVCGEFIWYTNK